MSEREILSDPPTAEKYENSHPDFKTTIDGVRYVTAMTNRGTALLPVKEDRLKLAANWVREEYNDYISVYEYSDHFRVTNGSAGMYADIRLSDGELVLSGERYGETFTIRTDRKRPALIEALGEGLGL